MERLDRSLSPDDFRATRSRNFPCAGSFEVGVHGVRSPHNTGKGVGIEPHQLASEGRWREGCEGVEGGADPTPSSTTVKLLEGPGVTSQLPFEVLGAGVAGGAGTRRSFPAEPIFLAFLNMEFNTTRLSTLWEARAQYQSVHHYLGASPRYCYPPPLGIDCAPCIAPGFKNKPNVFLFIESAGPAQTGNRYVAIFSSQYKLMYTASFVSPICT
jgi:hypothetical protein